MISIAIIWLFLLLYCVLFIEAIDISSMETLTVDFLNKFEKLYLNQQPNEAISMVESNLQNIVEDSYLRQEIEIVCPGNQRPIVNINKIYQEDLTEEEEIIDLDEKVNDLLNEEFFESTKEANEQKRTHNLKKKKKKCMVVKVKGHQFDMEFSVNCNQ